MELDDNTNSRKKRSSAGVSDEHHSLSHSAIPSDKHSVASDLRKISLENNGRHRKGGSPRIDFTKFATPGLYRATTSPTSRPTSLASRPAPSVSHAHLLTPPSLVSSVFSSGPNSSTTGSAALLPRPKSSNPGSIPSLSLAPLSLHADPHKAHHPPPITADVLSTGNSLEGKLSTGGSIPKKPATLEPLLQASPLGAAGPNGSSSSGANARPKPRPLKRQPQGSLSVPLVSQITKTKHDSQPPVSVSESNTLSSQPISESTLVDLTSARRTSPNHPSSLSKAQPSTSSATGIFSAKKFTSAQASSSQSHTSLSKAQTSSSSATGIFSAKKITSAQASSSQSHTNAQASSSRSHTNAQASSGRSHTNAQASSGRSHTNAQASSSRSHTNAQASSSRSHTNAQASSNQSHTNAHASSSRLHTSAPKIKLMPDGELCSCFV